MTPSTRPSEESESPDTLRQDAHAWLSRLTSGKVTQWEAQAFQRWRASSPSHQAAFEEARDQWRLLKPAAGNLLNTNPAAARYHQRMLRVPKLSRRTLLGAGLSAVTAAGVAMVYPPLGLWPAANEWDADYRTAAGEQRGVAVADNINVTLNTRTSIRRVAVDGRTVGIDLLGGEAAIEFQAARPFVVTAGAGRSEAASGRFEVRNLDGKVCVTCIEGAVRVEHPGGTRDLQARQQIIYDGNLISGVVGIDPEVVSAWRRGELVFKRTPLPAVLDEINRYRPGRVLLMDAALKNKTVSARFQLAALDTALLQIQRSFDLNARSLPGGVLVLS